MRANLAIRRTRLGTLDIDRYRRRAVRLRRVGVRRATRFRALAELIALLVGGAPTRRHAVGKTRRRPAAVVSH